MEIWRCLFCAAEVTADSLTCSALTCQTHLREMHEEQDRIDAADLALAVKMAKKLRCKEDSEWDLGRLARWFYTLKALLCIRWGWARDYKKFKAYDHPVVVVAIHHYATLYAGWESRTLKVGKGFFSLWWYEIESDGEWFM